MRRRFLGIPCTAFICALSPFYVDFFFGKKSSWWRSKKKQLTRNKKKTKHKAFNSLDFALLFCRRLCHNHKKKLLYPSSSARSACILESSSITTKKNLTIPLEQRTLSMHVSWKVTQRFAHFLLPLKALACGGGFLLFPSAGAQNQICSRCKIILQYEMGS